MLFAVDGASSHLRGNGMELAAARPAAFLIPRSTDMARQQHDQKGQEQLGGKGKKSEVEQEDEDLSIENESEDLDEDFDEDETDKSRWN
jgi:hypothetical protein